MSKKTTLKIAGMHCVTCAASIENALKKEEGVVSAVANFPLEKVTVEYDPQKINDAEIKQIIKNTGYQIGGKEEVGNEIKKGWRRFFLGLVLTLPVFVIAVFFYDPRWNLLLFALATPVQIFLGLPFYKGAFNSLKQKTANMDVLVALSTSAAYFYSVAATFFTKGPVFYEASTTVLTTITLGILLEKISRGKVSEAIQKLMELAPKREVKKGEVVEVKPGEAIPADGIIVEGETAIDESMVTGESIPVDKKVGDEVIGATINKTGYFKFRATKVGSETTLAQIIKLVEEAQTQKAPIQRVADKVVAYFVPVVLVIAVLSFSVWYFVLGENFLFSLTTLVAVLTIACPCALGIATPTAIMMGTALGAKKGILIKGGEYLEKSRQLTTIVFDKTGTLTKGEPTVTDVTGNVLQLAASVERKSEHPLAQAVVKKAEEEKLELLEVESFKAIPGKGAKGNFKFQNSNVKVLVGNRKLMEENNITIQQFNNLTIEQLEGQGKTVMLVSVAGEIRGAIAVADTLKEQSKTAIADLRKMGLEVLMITGDNPRTAAAIGAELGIKKDKILAEVLPPDKEKEIRRLQKEGKVVGAVGDGINDAPMLAAAEVGIAMGAGSDVAKETGGIILVKDDVYDVVRAIKLSRKTFLKIKQNLFLAFVYNVLAIPIAAGLFYHWLGFLLRPEIAALAMILSDISVIGNSLLLRRET